MYRQAGALLCNGVAQQRPRYLASLRLARNGLGAATALALAPLLDHLGDDLGASPAAAALPPLALALSRLRLVDQPEAVSRAQLDAQLAPARWELRAAAVAGRRFAARHGGGVARAPSALKTSELKARLAERSLEATGKRQGLVKRLAAALAEEEAGAAAILAEMAEVDRGRGQIDRDSKGALSPAELKQRLLKSGHAEAAVELALAKLEAEREAGSDPLRLIGPRALAAPAIEAAHSPAEATAQVSTVAGLATPRLASEAATPRLGGCNPSPQSCNLTPRGCDLTPQVSEADVRALRARLRAKLKQVAYVSGMHTPCTHTAHTTHTPRTRHDIPCTPHAHPMHTRCTHLHGAFLVASSERSG